LQNPYISFSRTPECEYTALTIYTYALIQLNKYLNCAIYSYDKHVSDCHGWSQLKMQTNWWTARRCI